MTDDAARAAVMSILSAAKVPLAPEEPWGLDVPAAVGRFREEVEAAVLRERARAAAGGCPVMLADLGLVDLGD